VRRGRETDFAISLGSADHQGFGFDKQIEFWESRCEGFALLHRERVRLPASRRSDLVDSASILRKKGATPPCVETICVLLGNASAQLLDKLGNHGRGLLTNSSNDPENLGIGRFDTDVATIRTADLAVGNGPSSAARAATLSRLRCRLATNPTACPTSPAQRRRLAARLRTPSMDSRKAACSSW